MIWNCNDEHLCCTRFTSVEHNNPKNFSCLLLTVIYLEEFLLSPSWIQFSCLNHTLDGCWHTLQQFDNKSYVTSFQCRQKNFHETVWWIHHHLVVYALKKKKNSTWHLHLMSVIDNMHMVQLLKNNTNWG